MQGARAAVCIVTVPRAGRHSWLKMVSTNCPVSQAQTGGGWAQLGVRPSVEKPCEEDTGYLKMWII
jgi:hypothetical protein